MGHLDLPQLRRAIDICGVTQLVITKVDCIPRYGNKITICESYTSGLVASASAASLEKEQPVYIELPSWTDDISTTRDYTNLPTNAQNYLTYLETQLDTPITRIGVGPNREQVIKRQYMIKNKDKVFISGVGFALY